LMFLGIKRTGHEYIFDVLPGTPDIWEAQIRLPLTGAPRSAWEIGMPVPRGGNPSCQDSSTR
jgi:hypothetical protein